MNWKYHKPQFEFERKSFDKDRYWGGHVFFAYDLVFNLKPDIVVELGTHHGTSFFSFCQAVKDNNLNSKLYAIDTWEGDKHAGFYDESVFKNVEDIKDSCYKDVNASLMKMTFDQALNNFRDNSIDILHIDGLHTYEAVKHDYDSWINKVKDDGIILFHDIDAINHKDFGVYKLWNELKEKNKTLEFHHSCGLGVLFKNSEKIFDLFEFEHAWRAYYSLKEENKKLMHELEAKDDEIKERQNKINSIRSLIFLKLQNSCFKFFNKK